ncbi:hypothetical protein HPP92_025417 [Vanilla planifolia]|uniref:Uncharacterized protein n=1 Tax=Vanilla planifolia TaxID=51239 RepID=A0A835U8Z8_VANPL|nr:hypothetical protein HPP92_025417 [Vanilla planifolia]
MRTTSDELDSHRRHGHTAFAGGFASEALVDSRRLRRRKFSKNRIKGKSTIQTFVVSLLKNWSDEEELAGVGVSGAGESRK